MQNRYPAQFNMLPPVVKNLLIINGILFLAKIVFQGQGIDLDRWLAFYHWKDERFELYQIFTYMFMHGNTWHLLFNMYALWMFGKELENIWGMKKFLNFYLICGLASALAHAVISTMQTGFTPPVIGASGAVYGILVGFGMMFPNSVLMLIFPPIPLKAKYFVIILILLDVYLGFSRAETGTAHFAHLGGALCGFLLMKFWIKRR